MRVLVVTAHYPPNFVSGGTLQPQRLARTLRAQGEDVSVYAGWLDDERRPLTTWDEVDETGLPVHWVVTSRRWTDWSALENYANSGIERDFRDQLARLKPDLVHFHSLQSFGAGLLAEARAAGARVVVTMHDFWWCCARQFLVDRNYQPCSLVVAAGNCQCQIDRPWLDQRNRRLATALRNADLVLAPSAIAAQVLSANGVAGAASVAVDENGVVAALRSSPATERANESLRLLYIGGPDRMKGVHVLLDAARSLAGLPGWELQAYGVADYLKEVRQSVAGLPVDVRPPFNPTDMDSVYAQADVLVLPSIMRESHSLATREALLRGLPVLCTDSLGPEEVVVHGVNGLVTRSADPDALAHAVKELVTDSSLLPRLRAGVRPPPVRTVEEQAVGLRQRYASLERSSGAYQVPEISRVLFVVGIDGAPLRYRAWLPAEALNLLGVKTDVRYYRDPDVEGLARRADAVVVYRVPATVQVAALIEGLHHRGTPVFFDVDDLIFDPDVASEIPALELLPPDDARLWLQGVNRYRTTMEMCDAFIGSTPSLCRHAEAVADMPGHEFANGVGLILARHSSAARARTRRPGPPRVGYLSGTNTHDRDWQYVEPALQEVLERHREVEVWAVGHLPDSPSLARFGDRIVRRPIQPWLELPDLLRDLDVNLAPLAPGSRFNEAKSAIKWLEAALVETPTIATPTEPFNAAIEHGRTGFFANDTAGWVDAIDRLLREPDLAARVGRAACRDALLRWSPHLQGRTYLGILGSAPRPREQSGWHAVMLDEPPTPAAHALEPYGPPRLRWTAGRIAKGVARRLRRVAKL